MFSQYYIINFSLEDDTPIAPFFIHDITSSFVSIIPPAIIGTFTFSPISFIAFGAIPGSISTISGFTSFTSFAEEDIVGESRANTLRMLVRSRSFALFISAFFVVNIPSGFVSLYMYSRAIGEDENP